MANVNDRHRGQLILITGLLVAVAFVALALLLNTAIYTENLASRGTDAGGRNALEVERTTVDGIRGLIDAENHREYETSDDVTNNVSAGIELFEERQRLRYSEHGKAIDISKTTIHEGSLLRQQNASRRLTNATSATNWTLASDIHESRDVTITFTDQAALDDSNDPEQAFNVTLVGDTGNRWSVYVYADGAATVISVKNGTETSPTTDICGPTATPTINLTAGTVDGQPCGALQFAKGIDPPYDLQYWFGTRAEGTYELTVNTTPGGATVEDVNFNDVTTGTSPYQVPAVYSVMATVEYESAQLRYRSRVRVAPGESA